MSPGRRRAWWAAGGAVLVAAGAFALTRGGDAAQPPPARPAAEVRSLIGSPRVGRGLAMSVEVRQSVVPAALLSRSALPPGTIPGRLWVRSADEWRLELRGAGHDWQLSREDGVLRLYSSASQTAYTAGRDLLPGSLRAAGPLSVDPPVPGTLAGRAVHRITYRPRGDDLLLDRVEIAADAATGAPLGIRAWSVGRDDPVLEMTATSVREEAVSRERITVRPPRAGSTVPLGTLLSLGRATGGLRVVGTGWERVVVLPRLPVTLPGAPDDGGAPPPALQTPLLGVVPVGEGAAVGLLPAPRVREAAGG